MDCNIFMEPLWYNGIRVNLLNSTQETDLIVAAHLVSFYMLQYVLTIQWMYVGSAWNFNFNNNKTNSYQMRLFEYKLCQEIQWHNKNKPFLSKCQVYFLLKCSLFLLEFLLLFLLFYFLHLPKHQDQSCTFWICLIMRKRPQYPSTLFMHQTFTQYWKEPFCQQGIILSGI